MRLKDARGPALSGAGLVGLWLILLAGLGAQSVAAAPLGDETAIEIVTRADDGAKVFGTAFFDELPADAPLILLFHQARSNGRGEYAPLVGWLNGLGFRVIAWDQRSGGGLYGGRNRTVAAHGGSTGYCAAYPDLEAALRYARAHYRPRRLIVWGSSYSGSLVFRLAAAHGDEIDAVVAFSPALSVCGGEKALAATHKPVLAVWPEREAEQQPGWRTLIAAVRAKGGRVIIVPDGVHGSSTLVDARTGHDMEPARRIVGEALMELAGGR